MSVMGGFKVDLLNRILGFNGHLGVYGAGAPLTDYDMLAAQIRDHPGRGRGDPGGRRAGAADRRSRPVDAAVSCAASRKRI